MSARRSRKSFFRSTLSESFIRDPNAVDRPQHLTDRQREVLQLLAEGRFLYEIGLVVADFLPDGAIDIRFLAKPLFFVPWISDSVTWDRWQAFANVLHVKDQDASRSG